MATMRFAYSPARLLVYLALAGGSIASGGATGQQVPNPPASSTGAAAGVPSNGSTGTGPGTAASAGPVAPPAPSGTSGRVAGPRPNLNHLNAEARDTNGNAERMRRKIWGVDQIAVRVTSSGSAVQFRYRVVDPQKAKLLNDPKAKPTITDLRTGIRLGVSTMEQIGTLRQVATPEAGREYWMVFSNPGKIVQPGSLVDVAIGSFRISDVRVE